MNKSVGQLPIIKLVGITARTSNALEMNQDTAKIGAIMQRFFMNMMQSQILKRKTPGRVFAVYTNYESNEHGEYTYFLGEEVDDFENSPQNFEILTIPAQTYVKFTSNPGQIPDIVMDMWQNIWKMNESSLGGQRTYIADFEIYDERSQDPQQAVLDIYIGIKQ
jgi:predicted transcriptional regulator YdeE